MSKTSSSRSDVFSKLDSLPATYRLNGDENPNSVLTVLRVLPVNRHRQAAWSVLKSNKVTIGLELFDSADCIDFGDDELVMLIGARSIQFLSLDGTAITDKSLKTMRNNWPNLLYIGVESCAITEEEIIRLLQERKLVFIRVPEECNNERFRTQVLDISPHTIVMCGGQDIMNQPESAFESIPWGKWN